MSENLQDYIKNKWDEDAEASIARWQNFYNDIAFYLGYQYSTWDSGTMAYSNAVEEEEATQKVYAVNNLIRPLADTRIARILAMKPIPICVSNSDSSEAITRAEKRTKILKALWLDMNMQSLLVEAVTWAVVTNHVFLRPYFDPEYGLELPNPKYDGAAKELTESLGEEYSEPDHFHPGRLNVDLFNPMCVQFDTTQPTWRDVMRKGWVIIKTITTKDSLYSRFDTKKVDRLVNEEPDKISTVEEQTLRLVDRAAYESRQKDKKLHPENYNNVCTYEYYEAPGHNYPEGLHAIVCQDELLDDGSLPTKKTRRIPVIMLRDQVGLKTLWGRSKVSDSRQDQKLYNILWSRIIEYSRLPVMYLIPRNSTIKEGEILGKPYIIVTVDPDEGQPNIINPNIPNPMIMSGMEKIETNLEHRWGQHEVSSRSSPPQKGMSGRSIFLLQEADTSRLSTTMNMQAESLSDFSEICLELGRKGFVEKRSMHYMGEGNQSQAVEFVGEEIGDVVEGDVSIEIDSEYKRNKEGLQNLFTSLLGVAPNVPAIAQILNDPMVAYKIVSLIDEGMANTFLMKNQDMATAEWENREMKEGRFPKVQPWHGHPAHIKVLMSLMNSDEYRAMTAEDQEKVKNLHLMPHLEFLKAGLQAQTGAKQAQEGQPPTEVFKEAPPTVGGVEAVDQAIEAKVQPEPGAYGQEVVP